ncbi:SPFH domain-containing protein [Mycolicibacterium sphagni]|uniref:Membrane protease subunit, stomatin/prohibitin n=1 Tax=Mycolicibacterium sphagni TaxID=1786 RepID=A0A255DQI2_9MYCO|nr:SPFH domain-containing protein [Mycolicibacterium sphagni]OYN81707.1 membrane protease subunit, stomatin/prohibitin [Mycolicibacterium sphagni]
MKRNKIVALAMAGAAAVTLSACSTSVPAGSQAVKVDTYAVIPTDPTVEGCIKPEQNEWNPPGGFDAYLYPSRQISFDASDDKDAEAPSTVVVSNAEAPAELKVPVTVTFDLTQDCEKLKQFHRDFGTKYQGWLTEEGAVTQGWKDLLNYVIGQPLRNTLVSIAQKYPWREIWNDEKIRIEFQNALTQTLPQVSKDRTNGVEYFTNFQVTVMKPDPVDGGLKSAIVAEQQAIAQAKATEAQGVSAANAAKATADAQVAQAEAQTKVAVQEALKRKAEISGYPDVDAYLKAQAITKGITPWPSPVIAGAPAR